MTSTFTTVDDVAEDILIDFQLDGVIANTSYRKYEDAIIGSGWDKGGQIRVPLPNKYIINDGATISSVPDINEDYTTLSLDYRKNIPMAFTTQQMTTESKFDFKERFSTPAVKLLSAQVETDLAQKMFMHTYHVTGTAGVCPSSYASIALLRARMNNMRVPTNNRTLGFSEECYADVISTGTLQNSFDMKLTRDINRDAQLGKIAQFDSYSTPVMYSHIAGVGDVTDTPANGLVDAGTVKTTITSGNTMTITGLGTSTPGVFEPGDKLIFSNVFFAEPQLRTTTNENFSVTITNAATVDADSGGDAIITFEPALVSAATDPKRNISNTSGLVATTAVSLVTGNSAVGSTTKAPYQMNFGYIPQAILFAAPPLANPSGIPTKDIGSITDKETKVSIRMYSFTEGLTDTSTHRLDMLYGIKIEGQYMFGLLG